MLLLFWRQDYIHSGLAKTGRWLHRPDYSPRYLIGTDGGIDIVSGYSDICNTCYTFLNTEANAIDFYNNRIIIGTSTSGLLYIPWNNIKDLPVCGNQEYTSSVYEFNPLNSNYVKALATQDYSLGVVTVSGFEYWNDTLGDFILVPTSSGNDAFITSSGGLGPRTYFCEGNLLEIYNGELPTTWTGWSFTCNTLNIGNLNDIWVQEFLDYDIVFLAGTLVTVVQKYPLNLNDYESRDFSNTISGSKNIYSITIEAGTDIDYGHYFTLSSDGINIITMQSDGYPLASGTVFIPISNISDFEFSRPYNK